MSASAIKVCKARATPSSTRNIHLCYICGRPGRAYWEVSDETETKFRLYKNLQLPTVLIHSRPAKEFFVLNFLEGRKLA